MSLLLAPYNDSMRLGMGFNSFTHTMCVDNAVKVTHEEKVRSENPSQVVTYSSKVVETLSETVSSMNISYCTSIRKGTIEIAGSTSAVQEDKIKQSDLNAIVAVKVVNQTTIINEDSAFSPLPGLIPGTKDFDDTFGDCYISGFIEGGDFNGIISIRVIDRSKVNAVASAVKKSLGGGRGKNFTLDMDTFSTGSDLSSAVKDTETTISVSWMGGGQIKESQEGWNFDSIFAAAAAFPARVAQCPQRTWAILTKYKANRSFQSTYNRKNFISLEYDAVASYTMDLFENFMEYKQLIKLVQDIITNPDNYTQQTGKPNSIQPVTKMLVAVKAAFRQEMNKIVAAVNVLSQDPSSLQRNLSVNSGAKDPVVWQIMNDAWDTQNSFLDHPAVKIVPATQPSGPPSVASTSSIVEVQHPSEGRLSATTNDQNGIRSTGQNTPGTTDDGTSPKLSQVAMYTPPASRPQLNYDFNRLIEPEIWSDLLPLPKTDGMASGSAKGELSGGSNDFWAVAPTDDRMLQSLNKPVEAKSKLSILAAVVGMTDLTDRLQQMVALDQSLVFTGIQLYGLASDRPAYKALPHFALQTAVLYQYTNGPVRLLTIKDPGEAEKDKSFSIRPESQDLVVKPAAWSTDGWSIVAVVYGGQCFNEDQNVMVRIQQELVGKTPRSVLFTDSLMGTDASGTHEKVGTIFYRAGEEGRMRIAVGLEGSLPATLTDVLTPEGVSTSNNILRGVLSAQNEIGLRERKGAQGSTIVKLNPPYNTTPRILHGLKLVDWLRNGSNANSSGQPNQTSFTLGYEISPDSVDEESFVARPWMGPDNAVWELEMSWLAIPRKTSFQIDSGCLEHGGYQSSGPTGNIQKVELTHNFKKPFSAPPKVVAWLVGLDLKQQPVDYYGIDTNVSATSATSFTITVSTWSVLHFAAVKVGWFAYDAEQDNKKVKVNSFNIGNQNLDNVRWDFGGQPFRGTPMTFCALSRFDYNTAENIRMACQINNTSSTGADIQCVSWMQQPGRETLHGLGMKAIAIEL